MAALSSVSAYAISPVSVSVSVNVSVSERGREKESINLLYYMSVNCHCACVRNRAHLQQAAFCSQLLFSLIFSFCRWRCRLSSLLSVGPHLIHCAALASFCFYFCGIECRSLLTSSIGCGFCLFCVQLPCDFSHSVHFWFDALADTIKSKILAIFNNKKVTKLLKMC